MKNIEELTFIFDALGEETRLKIVVSLLDKDLNVSSISEQLNMSQPHVSHHLRIF